MNLDPPRYPPARNPRLWPRFYQWRALPPVVLGDPREPSQEAIMLLHRSSTAVQPGVLGVTNRTATSTRIGRAVVNRPQSFFTPQTAQVVREWLAALPLDPEERAYAQRSFDPGMPWSWVAVPHRHEHAARALLAGLPVEHEEAGR